MSELRNVSHNKYATSFKPRFWTVVVLLNSDADCFHTVITLPPPDCEGFDSFSEGVSKSNI